jgi:hypothetical protein
MSIKKSSGLTRFWNKLAAQDVHSPTNPGRIVLPKGKRISKLDLIRLRVEGIESVPVRYIVPGSRIKISAI